MSSKQRPFQISRRLFLRHCVNFGVMSLCLSIPTSLWAAPGSKHKSRPASSARSSRLLMIDPGHGGHDPGAIGNKGTYEKDVTLDIGRRLAQHISRYPRLDAKLTREIDEFLPLRERVARGQAAKADLFISLHADSAPNAQARGLSAYTLSDQATDKFSRELAQRENFADKFGGIDLTEADQNVAAILMDLATHQARDNALRAKTKLVRGIQGSWPLLENPLRAANFAVLRAPDVPSVLIETGFLSNHKDEAMLRQPTEREKIARLLARELKPILEIGI